MRGRWGWAMVLLVASALHSPVAQAAPSAQKVRAYAQAQAAKAGWVGAQWQALEEIVEPESAWNPCASYPGRHDCSYTGWNSCGIPQANPCPQAWRGRLAASWREQVAYLLRYIRDRPGYGDPLHALWFRRSHGWY